MKTVLITGSSKGIGAEMARVFATNNYNVVINYNSSVKNAKNLENELLAKGFSVYAVKADISKQNEVKDMVEKTLKKFDTIDVLINNAAVHDTKLLIDTSCEDFNRLVNVNILGMFNTCKEIVPIMIEKKYGKIINISSIWGVVGASCEVVYSMTKAAVNGFTMSLARELGPSNINVNSIAPGYIVTEMNKDVNKKIKLQIKENTALNRLGNVGDIAKVALFLANDDSSFITGQIINVNGGWIV